MLVGIVASLLQLYGIAFSQESAPSAPAADVATPDSRLACPPDAKVDKDVKLIRAAYEAAYEQAKDTGEPDSLIQQLVGLSNETPDPAKKYALLLEAEAVATQYENYATALDLLAKRAEKFQIDGLKLKGQLLKRLAGPKVAADLVLFDQATDTAEQAMQAERFDVAAETASLALSVARAVDREQKANANKRGRPVGKAGKDEAGPKPVGPGLVKKATALQSQVTATQKLFAEYGEALTNIKSQPDDAAANSVVAQYLCFVRGDWQRGLPALAKSDIVGLNKVAADEIDLLNAKNRDPKRLFELAGAWWSASDSKGLTDDQQAAVQDHAAGFYAEVAESLSDVLEKKLAQSRLRGLAVAEPSRDLKFTVRPEGVTITGYAGKASVVTIPDTIQGRPVVGIDSDVFSRRAGIEAITLPKTVANIGNMTFYKCVDLKSVNMPENLTTIGFNAFEFCSSLGDVSIPARVAKIGAVCFVNCPNTKAISVADANPDYASVDGILYDKEVRTLITCPAGKRGEVRIPPSVTTILGWSFLGCDKLKRIVIPNTVTDIQDNAFAGCDAQRIVLSK